MKTKNKWIKVSDLPPHLEGEWVFVRNNFGIVGLGYCVSGKWYCKKYDRHKCIEISNQPYEWQPLTWPGE